MSQCGATTSRGGSCRNAMWSCPNHAMPQWITMGVGFFILYAVWSDVTSGELVPGKPRFPGAILEILQTVTVVGLVALMVLTVTSLLARTGRKLFFQTLLAVGGVSALFLYGAGFF